MGYEMGMLIPLMGFVVPGLLILNPGSITFPRQRGREKSYMILELEEGRSPQAQLKFFPAGS